MCNHSVLCRTVRSTLRTVMCKTLFTSTRLDMVILLQTVNIWREWKKIYRVVLRLTAGVHLPL